jgi:hypothetical protein
MQHQPAPDAAAVTRAAAPTDPERRRFIAAALALTAGAGLAGRALSADRATAGSELSESMLLSALGNAPAAARIGAAYLAAHPEEADTDVLVRRLRLALQTHAGPPPAGRDALIRALTRLVESEYCFAPLVRADGWLMAPSEARLYALAARAGAGAGSPGPVD